MEQALYWQVFVVFTGDPRFLSKNPLFQKIKDQSVFMRSAAPPPIVETEFGRELDPRSGIPHLIAS